MTHYHYQNNSICFWVKLWLGLLFLRHPFCGQHFVFILSTNIGRRPNGEDNLDVKLVIISIVFLHAETPASQLYATGGRCSSAREKDHFPCKAIVFNFEMNHPPQLGFGIDER